MKTVHPSTFDIRYFHFLFFSLLLLTLVPQAYGGGFAVKRTVDGYTFDISMNRNPSVGAVNELQIEIKDVLGKFAVPTAVMVNYYMPPMPSMPPMNYKVKAASRGKGYNVAMNLIMAGPWIIVVNTNVGGKNLRVSVPIDVR